MSKKLDKKAMDAWENVKTKEDLRQWHLIFTPWFTPVMIDKIVDLYEEKVKSPEKNDLLPEESKFEKLWKKSY